MNGGDFIGAYVTKYDPFLSIDEENRFCYMGTGKEKKEGVGVLRLTVRRTGT